MSDIIAARELIDQVIRNVKRKKLYVELQDECGLLDAAKLLMERKVTKKIVRTGLHVTEAHYDKLRAIVARGCWEHYTVIELSDLVFGSPNGGGRISEMLKEIAA